MRGEVNFDGLFIKDKAPYGVEVKYSLSGKIPLRYIDSTLGMTIERVQALTGRNVNIILVIVLAEDSLLSSFDTQKLQSSLSRFDGRVQYRVFSLPKLAAKYGISY